MAAGMGIDERDWALLVLLSILWGGSPFFTGIAVRELPPLTIVLARVAIAAVLLLPVLWGSGTKLPASAAGWMPFLVRLEVRLVGGRQMRVLVGKLA